MGFFDKFKAGLAKTHSKLVHEITRIVTLSPKLDEASLEELEASLIGAHAADGRLRIWGLAHSGPAWLAMPSPDETFIHCTAPV